MRYAPSLLGSKVRTACVAAQKAVRSLKLDYEAHYVVGCGPLRGVPSGRLSEIEPTPPVVDEVPETQPDELLLLNFPILPFKELIRAVRLSLVCRRGRVGTFGILAGSLGPLPLEFNSSSDTHGV
jgi:hypothetical protein